MNWRWPPLPRPPSTSVLDEVGEAVPVLVVEDPDDHDSHSFKSKDVTSLRDGLQARPVPRLRSLSFRPLSHELARVSARYTPQALGARPPAPRSTEALHALLMRSRLRRRGRGEIEISRVTVVAGLSHFATETYFQDSNELKLFSRSSTGEGQPKAAVNEVRTTFKSIDSRRSASHGAINFDLT
ncbi:hypothetical protein EVAR_17393_1 [Eumeta japonica]|uniref:Uncharacterized protein n=1 Tax=Eumeta variegata TaxID=151549 RepID=A0A4C1VB20_EUMVA|nr:hypothetical protein EVAR_17393_1 [Eumeta japonica]